VRVGRDDDHSHAAEARGVDYLPVKNLFRVVQELRREEEAHAHLTCVFGL